MSIREYVKEVERNYREGQNIFRRRTVGYLLQRISELEKEAAQQEQSDAIEFPISDDGMCAECGSPKWVHSVVGHDYVPPRK